jgi:hypothetical protein
MVTWFPFFVYKKLEESYMAMMKKIPLKDQYVQVPNKTAKAVESGLSLQALGLIVNLWSYDVEKWELFKTELYKRFSQNKETSVRTAWQDLMDHNYLIEFKFRDGRSWDYVYYYRIEPFTEEEKIEILHAANEEYGEISTLDFKDPKKETSKRTPQNQDISNNRLKKNKLKKNNNNFVNKEDDPFSKDGLINIANSFYNEVVPGRWSKDQWNVIVDKLVDELMDGQEVFTKALDPYSYIRSCLSNICYKHDLKHGKVNAKYPEGLPYFNWLE